MRYGLGRRMWRGADRQMPLAQNDSRPYKVVAALCEPIHKRAKLLQSRAVSGRCRPTHREGIQIVVHRNGSANGAANGLPSLQDSTIHRLLVGSHRLAGHLNSACDQAGVSLPLARALQFLAGAHEPVRPTQLSRELGRSPAATSELIKRLVKSRQITADVDPDDRRSFLLTLTDAGRAKWHEVQGSLQHAEATIESGYGGQRLEALAGELDELVTALDKTPA